MPEITLAFADGDVILGEAMVGRDDCPSVRWTHFPNKADPETITPDTFPEGAPTPTKPAIPSDEDSTSPRLPTPARMRITGARPGNRSSGRGRGGPHR